MLGWSTSSASGKTNMIKPHPNIRFGRVWRAVKDYEMPAYSGKQKGCVIPKGTRIVVLNSPPPGATAVHCMCIDTDGLDSSLLPNLRMMEYLKEGFGVTIGLDGLQTDFVLDEDQSVEFSHEDSRIFYQRILEHQ